MARHVLDHQEGTLQIYIEHEVPHIRRKLIDRYLGALQHTGDAEQHIDTAAEPIDCLVNAALDGGFLHHVDMPVAGFAASVDDRSQR